MTTDILSRTISDTPANESDIRGMIPLDYCLMIAAENHDRGIQFGERLGLLTALELALSADDKHDAVSRIGEKLREMRLHG